MTTNLDCVPCFFTQALAASREAGLDQKGQKDVLDAVARLVPGFSLKSKPPQMALSIHHAVKRISGVCDPYRDLKKRSNEAVLAVYAGLESRLRTSTDKLRDAVNLSLAGNLLDYGASADLDIERCLDEILRQEEQAIESESRGLYHLEALRSVLSAASRVLIIGDNAGEVVFDKLLVQTLLSLYPAIDVTYAVRSAPIINDATLSDAEQAGLTEVCRVIESGSPAPGMLLSYASHQLESALDAADVVISKGQGNFEALSDEPVAAFFLFRAKCRPIAEAASAQVGDVVLLAPRA